MAKYFVAFFSLGAIFGALFWTYFKIEKVWVIFFVLAVLSLILGIRFAFLRLFFIFFMVSALVIWRGEVSFPESILSPLQNQKISGEGKIIREPDIRDSNTRLIIKLNSISNNGQTIFLNENIILVVPKYPEFEIGQRISFSGKIQLPENFENENGIVFDYINYLKKDKIYSSIYYPQIEIREKNSPHALLPKIFWVKQKFLENLQKILPSPEAELLGGILLGAKRSLGEELEKNFRRVGPIHIVVLSGYNITIIAEGIFRFLGFLPKIFQNFLGLFSIIIFAVMVGSGATVIRSTIMTSLAIFARTSNRTYDVNRALFLAGSLMIMENPMILIFDPSFQLSFVATLGLVHISEKLNKFLFFVPEKFGLRDIISATFSTQIAVLPLLIKMTGEISVVAPIVNIITLQFIPFTMFSGFIAGLVSFLSENLGLILAFIPYLFLTYILKIVALFAELGFATFVF